MDSDFSYNLDEADDHTGYKQDPRIRLDEEGIWINTAYPADGTREEYPTTSGYRTVARELLFYHFPVIRYNLKVTYKGIVYLMISESDDCRVLDENNKQLSPNYDLPNDLIASYRFPDGKSLTEIVDLDPKVVFIDIY